MSQSILVNKLTILKELKDLSLKIESRPEFTFVGKQRYRTENLPRVAETDAKFITAIIININPLCHISFITDNNGENLKGIKIESDFDCINDIEKYINDNFDFNTNKNQFEVLETLTNLINTKIVKSFNMHGVFGSTKELCMYIERYLEYTESFCRVLEKIDFNSKKTIIRIIQNNIDACKEIQKYANPIEIDSMPLQFKGGL